jgi:hypothetical protein
MECLRCQGLMVGNHFFDLEGTQDFMWMKGWRCMNCGHAVDPLIEANRRSQEATIRMLLCEEPDMEKESVPDEALFGGVEGSSRRSRNWSRHGMPATSRCKRPLRTSRSSRLDSDFPLGE